MIQTLWRYLPKLSALLALLVLLCLPVMAQDGATAGTKIPDYEIVANQENRNSGVRVVYALAGEKDFTREAISQVIRQIREQFCAPYTLSVIIFSDRKMIEWYMNGVVASSVVHFSTTSEGRKQATKYYSKVFPPETGYFRVFYRRNEGFEYFSISPRRDSIDTDLIVVQDSTGSLKADGFAKLPKSACKIDR